MATGASTTASNMRKFTASNSLTAAIAAVERGDLLAVEEFLNASPQSTIDLTSVDSKGRKCTLLQAASMLGHLEIVRLLIDRDCRVSVTQPDTGDTPLILALANGHEAVAEELLSHEKCHSNAQNVAGWTALMLAAKGGHIKAMEELLLQGQDLELKTLADGETALTLAVTAAHLDAVKLLLDYGANAEHPNGQGCKPLDLARSLQDDNGADGCKKRQIIEALTRSRIDRDRRGLAGCKRFGRRAAASSSSDDEADAGAATTDSSLIGGRYKTVGQLGTGAHGVAVLVRDLRSNRGGRGRGAQLKVLKRINRQGRRFGLDDSVDENRELSLLKRLDHSCVLTLLDYFKDIDNNLCLITEYCEFRDLHTWIQWASATDIALPFNLVTHWVLQMLLGLAYLHNRKIVHGDIKPTNVFVQSDATLRIGDFGCSLQLNNSTDCNKASISGTWMYMSPELISSDGRGTASDMWSLGCTVFELCTCRPLFDPNQPGSKLRQQICGESRLDFALSPLLPQWMSTALPRLLRRYPSSERAAAADLLLEEDIARDLQAMQPDLLAVDRLFLADNFAGLSETGDEVSATSSHFRGVDYSQAYDALLADIQRFVTTAAAEKPDNQLMQAMAQLENLRTLLEQKQRKENFPLDKVYNLLSKVSDDERSDTASRPATSHVRARQQNLEKQLAALTKDTEACEMVQLAIVLERQCVPMTRDGL